MTEPQPKIIPVSDVAIIVNPADNVAVVKNETHAGMAVQIAENEIVVVKAAVPPGHRFAVRDIPEGEFVRQYNQPIGTSLGIGEGEWVTHENMTDEVPIVRDLAEDISTPAPDYFDLSEVGTFMGFRRAD